MDKQPLVMISAKREEKITTPGVRMLFLIRSRSPKDAAFREKNAPRSADFVSGVLSAGKHVLGCKTKFA